MGGETKETPTTAAPSAQKGITEEQFAAHTAKAFGPILEKAGIKGGLEGLKTLVDSHEKLKEREEEAVRDGLARKAFESMEASEKSLFGVTRLKADKWEGAGWLYCRALRANAIAKQDSCTPIDIAKGWGDDFLVQRFEQAIAEREQKTLAGSVGTQGGYLIPQDYLANMIPLLLATSVLNQVGATELPMPKGQLTMPRLTSGVTTTWTGENQVITASTPAVDRIHLMEKKLAAIVASSNEMLRFADPVVDTWLRDLMTEQLGLGADLAGLRGTGTLSAPKGIRFSIAAANLVARTQDGGTSTLAEIVDDLYDMVELVEGNNVDISAAGYIGTTRTKSGIARRLNANGFFVFAEELNNDRLIGFPYRKSNQIPVNLGGGTDETELYFGPGKDLLIGRGAGLEIEFFPNGTYNDGSNAISGISQDLSVFRAKLGIDFALAHNVSWTVRTAVDWFDV